MMHRNRHRPLFSSPHRPKPPQKKWRILHFLRTGLRRTCTALGAAVLFSIVMGMFYSSMLLRDFGEPAVLPDEMVLYLPLKTGLAEHENSAGRYAFKDDTLTLRDVTNALDRAAGDPRVRGFVAKLAGGELELTHVEELREAIARFRESGKFAYIYAASYDTLGQYYFASAFEQIWLQPMGVVSIPGVQVEIPYARAVLDKIGVQPQIFARKEYKNLFESATETEMSTASREMMTALVGDLGKSIIDGVTVSREMKPGEFQGLVNKALFTSDEALDAGLIDRLDYADGFNAEIKQMVKGDPENDDDLFATVSAYVDDGIARNLIASAGHKPRVALIYAVGQISQYDESGSDLAAADTLVANINEAVDDEQTNVIVLRIDSPGGDPTASETIRRAVVRAKEKGKKIVVSMGGSAASGGYWIATDADYIFAAPTTFTGSIGVTGGKFSLKEMWAKIGVNWDGVRWGDNAGLWSFNQPYTPSEAARMEALMDHVYNAFVERVANGRHMTPEQADKIAGGRVWTGAQAKENGLVDELGSLDRALDYAATLAGATDRHGINVIVMPRVRTPFEKLIELLAMQVSMGNYFHANKDVFMKVSAALRDVTSFEPGWGIAGK